MAERLLFEMLVIVVASFAVVTALVRLRFSPVTGYLLAGVLIGPHGLGLLPAPNTSALFVLLRKVQPEKVLDELKGFRGRVIRSSLSPEQEARLQAALSGSNVSMPGTAGAASDITNPTSSDTSSDASTTPSTAPAQGAAS